MRNDGKMYKYVGEEKVFCEKTKRKYYVWEYDFPAKRRLLEISK